jgi:hypothetical protein
LSNNKLFETYQLIAGKILNIKLIFAILETLTIKHSKLLLTLLLNNVVLLEPAVIVSILSTSKTLIIHNHQYHRLKLLLRKHHVKQGKRIQQTLTRKKQVNFIICLQKFACPTNIDKTPYRL